MEALHASAFYSDGRGPDLIEVHLAKNSAHLLAIDFKNPDSMETDHLVFIKAQSYMFTPNEVVGDGLEEIDYAAHPTASLFSLGKSKWFDMFHDYHLENCIHIRAVFYDEDLDVICEGVAVGNGSYLGGL